MLTVSKTNQENSVNVASNPRPHQFPRRPRRPSIKPNPARVAIRNFNKAQRRAAEAQRRADQFLAQMKGLDDVQAGWANFNRG